MNYILKNNIYIKVATFFLLFSISYSNNNDNSAKIELGIDVFLKNTPPELKNKSIILLANQASRTSENKSSVEEILKKKDIKLQYILVPEHGYYTSIPAGDAVADDSIYNIPLISLYGKSKTPSKTLLLQTDAIVIDIQDIGVRSYTYISTVFNIISIAIELGKPVYILDRPNPLGGLIVDGTLLEDEFESFVGKIRTTYLHGCTIGELTQLMIGEKWIKNQSGNIPDINIIKMKNWNRWQVWEDLGLNWMPTSPHIPTINSIRGAAALGTIGELGIISIGIGTTSPFQYLGSPNFDNEKLINELGNNKIINDYNINLIKVKYRPFYGMYNNKNVDGVYLSFKNNNEILPYSLGFEILNYLKTFNNGIFSKEDKSYNMFNKVNGSDIYTKFIRDKVSYDFIKQKIKKDRIKFNETRQKYLLY